MRNRSLELKGSVLASVSGKEGDAILQLRPACILVSGGIPGADASTLERRAVDLLVRRAGMVGGPPGAPAPLAGGRLDTPTAALENLIPLPLMLSGEAALELTFESGERLRIAGEDIESLDQGEMET